MKIVKPRYQIVSDFNGMQMLQNIEYIARTCYKSENNISDLSAVKMVKSLIARGHEAMLEHQSLSVKFICDRGVSHELVRHRLASFAQESTRYCNYSKDKFDNEISVVDLSTGFKYDLNNPTDKAKYSEWVTAMHDAETHYMNLLSLGATPQEARSVLPTSTKTEVVMTMNLREWRHFFKLRAVGVTGAPHPQMTELTVSLLADFKVWIPEIFDDLVVQE